MAAKILVVDPNEAFATMLRVTLEADGGYEVEVVDAGAAALAVLGQKEFDLTILDMDLAPEDLPYQEVARRVREIRPAMRLMLIPLAGKDLPEDARSLDIQGTLSKPFFVDDLLPNIRDVLSRQVLPVVRPAVVASVSEPEQPGSRAVRKIAPEAEGVLTELARETNADAVLLVSTAEGGVVLAHASTLRAGTRKALAEKSVATVQAVQAMAHLLGQGDAPFEHNMFESSSMRLYIMSLGGGLLLAVVGPVGIPLGTVRHNLRRAAREVALSLT